jgi:hypothetical protein
MRRTADKFNCFREGRIHVKSQMCKTCIFRPNGFHLEPGRLETMVSGAIKNKSAIVCHSTLKELKGKDNAVCRGFFDRYKTPPLVLAGAMGLIEFDGDKP